MEETHYFDLVYDVTRLIPKGRVTTYGAIADYLALGEGFRVVKKAAGDAGDNATEGIVDDWTDEAEQRAWFLFEAGRGL